MTIFAALFSKTGIVLSIFCSRTGPGNVPLAGTCPLVSGKVDP